MTGPEGEGPDARRATSGAVHLAVAVLVGAAALLVVLAATRSGELAALTGWVVAGLAFLGWVWAHIWPLDAPATATHAQREDPSQPASDLTVLAAAVVSLLTAAFVFLRGHQIGAFLVGLVVLSVIVAWALVHTVFTLRYTRLYYSGVPGGVDFGSEDELPSYRDFAYLAFTVGMTFQVSDTTIRTSEIRAAVLRQALISYLFGVVIIAVTVNVLVGLGPG